MTLVQRIRRLLQRLGYDVVHYAPSSHPLLRRRRLFDGYGIDLVLDVGANSGQFGQQLRIYQDYAGEIVSFEPAAEAYAKLVAAAAGDARWRTFREALGDAAGRRTLHVAGNSVSSSFLDMRAEHLAAAPESRYTGDEDVPVRTLDEVYPGLAAPGRRVYLKIDTQGYERQVLAGAERSLASIDTLQVELSLEPLYQGSADFDEIYASLAARGYRLVSIEGEFADAASGRLLQFDGIFHRARPSAG